MNREFLKELGLEDETINKVMAEYGKSIQDLKPAKEELETIQSEKKSLENQLNELQQTLASKDEDLKAIDDLKNQIENYKLNELKVNVARQEGIPFELINRLNGKTEEELKGDAKTLANFVNKKPPLPLKPTEPQKVDEKEQAYAKILENLK